MDQLDRSLELSRSLFTEMDLVNPYPAGVEPVPEMLPITAFFPGGAGLWLEGADDPRPDILVLGQDFATAAEYDRMRLGLKSDLASPTWRNLIRIFQEAGIPLPRCLFSNVFMGLRQTEKMTAPIPCGKDLGFRNRNRIFLSLQIQRIAPRLIITLVRPASEMLASAMTSPISGWFGGKALTGADQSVITAGCGDVRGVCCVALAHPSLRHLNLARRSCTDGEGSWSGHEAEIRLLRAALAGIERAERGA